MFLIYVHGISDGLHSYIHMFADNSEIMKQIVNNISCREYGKTWTDCIDGAKTRKWSSVLRNVIFWGWSEHKEM